MATLEAPSSANLPSSKTSTPAATAQTNHYIRRLASSPYKCLVCLRPTSIILVSNSIPSQDWFPSCESHLTDRHFATRLQSAASLDTKQDAAAEKSLSSKVSKEEIEKVKKEWEEREKEKKLKKEKADKDKEEKSKATKDQDEPEKGKGWLETLASPFSSSNPQEEAKPSGRGASLTSASVSKSIRGTTHQSSGGSTEHERYSLHRDFYQMRVDERKKREAVKRAAELKMPQAPKGAVA